MGNKPTALSTFLLSILGGIAIGIGGAVFINNDNAILGAFLFCVGLFSICCFGWNLYTGKVGYLVHQKPSYLLFLCNVWIGNYLGTGIVAWLLRCTRFIQANDAHNLIRVQALVETKLNDSFFSIFILSIFCGMLMYIAVDNYKNNKNDFAKIMGILLCVMCFILCGFEHSVANMFYYHLAGSYSLHAFLSLLVMSLGNACGSCLISGILKIAQKENAS